MERQLADNQALSLWRTIEETPFLTSQAMTFSIDKLESKIQLDELEIQLHLGVSEKERANIQSIWLSLAFEFSSLPNAASSDLISETINYSTLSKLLKGKFNDGNI